jgi:hypothetical protein
VLIFSSYQYHIHLHLHLHLYLQAELRDESAKNGSLAQELSVLKELADVGNSEMQERVSYVERERGRERSRLEGQLTDVKEQLRQQVEQKQQRDQLTATIEQQLSREREAKFAAMQVSASVNSLCVNSRCECLCVSLPRTNHLLSPPHTPSDNAAPARR